MPAQEKTKSGAAEVRKEALPAVVICQQEVREEQAPGKR